MIMEYYCGLFGLIRFRTDIVVIHTLKKDC